MYRDPYLALGTFMIFLTHHSARNTYYRTVQEAPPRAQQLPAPILELSPTVKEPMNLCSCADHDIVLQESDDAFLSPFRFRPEVTP